MFSALFGNLFKDKPDQDQFARKFMDAVRSNGYPHELEYEADTFRIQARFNRVEYADVEADLNRFPAGAARAGRIRLLIRLGYAAANGLLPHPAPVPHPHSAKVVDISSHSRSDSHPSQSSADPAATIRPLSATAPVPVADSLDSISDLNPADFQFSVSP